MAISLDPHLLADLSCGSGEPRGGSIWRDPHIQRQFLAVHLDDSTAAVNRNPQAVRRPAHGSHLSRSLPGWLTQFAPACARRRR